MSQWTDNNLSFLLRDYAEAVGMGPGDVAAAIAPANTGATGYLFPVLAPLLCGAGAVLLEDWDPAAALGLLEAERATHARPSRPSWCGCSRIAGSGRATSARSGSSPAPGLR